MITEKTKLIVITDLHNPSGIKNKKEILDEILGIINKSKIYLLCDEVYRDFIFDRGTLFKENPEKVITTNSLTKVYGLGGLRIGWAFCNKYLADKLSEEVSPYYAGISDPSLTAALELMKEFKRIEDASKKISSRNYQIVRGWAEKRKKEKEDINFIFPEHGIIFFPRLLNVEDTYVMVDRLIKEYKTYVAPGKFFGKDFKQFVRIGFGNKRQKEIIGGLKNLGSLLDEYKKEQ